MVAALAAATGRDPEVSIDTSKAAVAEAALDGGAAIVNDVTALRADPELAGVCARAGVHASSSCTCSASPRTMQDDPRYDDVVDDVRAFLAERIEAAVAAGIDERADLGRPRDRLRQDGRAQPRAAAAASASCASSGARS